MIKVQKIQFATTIYNYLPLKNTGGDPILRLSSADNKYTRILLSKPNSIPTTVSKVDMQLTVANADLLQSGNFSVQLYGISSSWDSGFDLQSYSKPSGYGTNWVFRNKSVAWTTPGGDIYPSVVQSIQLGYNTIYDNILFDLTNQSYNNFGFILMHANQGQYIGDIMIYSPNTNTVFQPKYLYYIDDYEYDEPDTGSNYIVTSETADNYTWCVQNIQYSYKSSDVVKFMISIHPKVYTRDWSEQFLYPTTQSAVADDSITLSYAVYDVSQIQKLMIIPHSQYTRISCENNRNYFNFDMRSLQPGRYYVFELKVNERYYYNTEIMKLV